MALANCKECDKEISTTAKTCPHCGVKKPYKPEPIKFRDQPAWVRWFMYIFGFPVMALFLVAVLWSMSRTEEKLLKKLETIEPDSHKELFITYKNLYNTSDNYDYADKAIEHGKKYLKRVAVADSYENLSIYKQLAEIDKNNNYSNKIKKYSYMQKVIFKCEVKAAIEAQNRLKFPDTYDYVLGASNGSWDYGGKNYTYTHTFTAKNAFGVQKEHIIRLVCTPKDDFSAYSYRVTAFK